ncbi:MAG: serpin family protein [Thermoplasmatales archaeon]|nr:MAG: serpin family protein [Thermoplasmatales archaeon]
MSKNSLAAVIVALLIISASIIYLTIKENESDVIIDELESDKTPVFAGNISGFRDAINVFSFDLFKKLYSSSEGNVFYSPYSVFTALAMTYEGSNSDTAVEMRDVLNIEQDNESFHNYMKNLYILLNKNAEYDISTANALWIKKNLNLLKDYLSVIETYYGGVANETDFSNPELAAGKINHWVENNTNGLIKDLIQSSHIDPLYTALILTNAIYFKGVWKIQFDPVNTTDRSFEIDSDVFIDVETMSLVNTKDYFNYTETEDLQLLELQYSGDDLSMIILLPKEKELSEIIDSFDADQFKQLIESMNEEMVDIYLPKFKYETSYGLNEPLIELGMANAFSSYADFSKITGARDLQISDVLHKAYIDINEEGTEAAAATAVIMVLTSNGNGGSSRIVFDADHPFLYIVQHKETGTILFIGSVTNPAE